MANTRDFVVKNGLQINNNSTVAGDISLGDNNKLKFGASDDLQIYHDGSNSYVRDVGTGNLLLKGTNLALQSNTGTLLYGYDGGALELYYNDAKKLATTSTGVDVTGTAEIDTLSIGGTVVSATPAELNLLDGATVTTTEINYNDITTLGTVQASKTVTANSSGNVNFPDGYKAQFGAGADLQIFHDGSNSYIKDAGTGYLVIQANAIGFANAGNNENLAFFTQDGAATLYYDNAAKIATTSTGIDVIGNITVSGTVDGRDLATDGTKLDGIESGATADQTITAGSGLTGGGTGDVTLYHADTSSQASVNNSNGTVIQDVTLDGYGHVTAMGSVDLDGRYYTETEADSRFLRSDANDTSSGTIAFGTDPLDPDSYTGYSGGFGNIADGSGWSARGVFVSGGTGKAAAMSAGSGNVYFGTQDGTNANSMATWLQVTQSTKVASFTNTPTVSGSTIWHAGNDGSGSGLDADLLDGQHGSYYAAASSLSNYVPLAGGSMSGELNITYNGGTTGATAPQYYQGQLEVQTSSNNTPAIGFHRGGYSATTLYEYDGELYTNAWTTRSQTGKLLSSGNISSYAWTSGNDGSGSGLDADTVDGLHAASFLRSDADDTATGNITFSDNVRITAVSESWSEGLRIDQPTVGAWGGVRFARNGSTANSGNWALGFSNENNSDVTFWSGTNAFKWRLDHSGNNTVYGSSRAPIFYDYNDTSYYLDPNSTSDTAIRVRGGALFGPNISWGDYLMVGGDGRNNYTNNTTVASVVTTDGNLHLDAASGHHTYINYYDGDMVYFGSGNNGIVGSINNSGSASFPIYYDWNDTAYYVDPASTGTSINVRGEIQNPSVWINDGDNYNSYNENIRLFANAGNNVSVIAFRASGTSGTPTSSILGYSDRHEVRWNDQWQTRVYNGYEEAYGSYRAPIFYDSNDTTYYANPASTSNFDKLNLGNWNASGYIPLNIKPTQGNTGILVGRSASYTTTFSVLPWSGGRTYLSSGTHYENGTWTIQSDGGSAALFAFAGADGAYWWAGTGGSSYTNVASALQLWDNAGKWKSEVATSKVTSTDGHFGDQGVLAAGYALTAYDSSRYLIGLRKSGADANYPWLVHDDWNGAGLMFHFNGIGDRFYFSEGGIGQAHNDFRAPTFYDADNTAYYVDPHSNSNLYRATVNARLDINGTNAPSTWAYLNIGYSGGGETRAIDIDGGWGGSESKSITFTHGSLSTNIVGQINCQHNGPGSRLRWGKLYHSGDSSTYTMELVSTSTTAADLSVSGNITASANVTAYSDERLKDNIEVIPHALDKVKEIRGVTYNRNDLDDTPRHTGVIAQEVEKVLPEVVSENEHGLKQVAYGNMVGLLIEAIKELKNEVDELKAQLAAK